MISDHQMLNPNYEFSKCQLPKYLIIQVIKSLFLFFKQNRFITTMAMII